MVASCDRLVQADITDPRVRARHAKLVAVLLVAPFLVVIPVVQLILAQAQLSQAMAAACALFGAFWSIVVFLSWSGRLHHAGALALVPALAAAAGLGALGAGAGNPALALLVAVPAETFLMSRDRRLAGAAGIAALLAAGLGMAASPLEPVAPGIWHWLAPAIYAMIVAWRFQSGSGRLAEDASLDLFEHAERTHAAVAQIGAGGEVSRVSPGCGVLLGIDPAMLCGSGLFDRVHVADRVAYLRALSLVRREPERAQKLEVRLRLAADESGGHGVAFRHFALELTGDAEGGGALAVLQDVSEIAELRRKLADASARVEESEIAQGRFLASVSHELRTPLNAIIGFSDLLLSPQISGRLEVKQSEQVGLIRQAGDHLLSVVNAILDVSKVEAGTYPIVMEPFALSKAVQLSCSLVMPQAQEHGVALSTRIPASVGEVDGDQRAVQQILINLLSNAVKFTPRGGTVRVTACRGNAEVRLRVSDNGIGIEAEDLERLGQPFMQVQNDYTRQFDGTGLGLSLVKGLVKLHGGAMVIESAPGLGTSVTVTLPAAATGQDDAGAALQPAAAMQMNKNQARRIHGATLLKIA